ncbi:MAG: di-trans,poly-cis-decaprenylcistransferase [Phycisphaerae bacterium]|mgnify:CR=1 FL=1|jgi:undecaprenyl diphosphate synthase|nr:di-trans,poly-cis-decaprenylcistransferase [Phycisphaerae bacterium]
MKEIPSEHIPEHIAIIMDGNGRWAEANGMDRSQGHIEGAKSVKKIVERCVELGVKYLTLYSFSTENWSRPEDEVDALMQLLMDQLAAEAPALAEQGICLKHYGGRDNFSKDVLGALDKAISLTAGGTVLTIGLALDYSGRSELIHAMNCLVEDGVEITQESLEERLYTSGMPDPDLLIRTAGEYRVSNFLLWQIAYSEIYVSDLCWPEFDMESLDKAVVDYASRTRKFGTVK